MISVPSSNAPEVASFVEEVKNTSVDEKIAKEDKSTTFSPDIGTISNEIQTHEMGTVSPLVVPDKLLKSSAVDVTAKNDGTLDLKVQSDDISTNSADHDGVTETSKVVPGTVMPKSQKSPTVEAATTKDEAPNPGIQNDVISTDSASHDDVTETFKVVPGTVTPKSHKSPTVESATTKDEALNPEIQNVGISTDSDDVTENSKVVSATVTPKSHKSPTVKATTKIGDPKTKETNSGQNPPVDTVKSKKEVNTKNNFEIIPWLIYVSVFIIFFSYVFCFIFFRVPEILSLVSVNYVLILLVGIVFFSTVSLIRFPPSKSSFILRRMALIALVCYQIKHAIDQTLKIDLANRSMSHSIVVVTGANSGVGLAVSKLLVGLGATVVMACRSTDKCKLAAATISQTHPNQSHHIVPMQLDLSDLESVWSFKEQFKERFDRLDVLINNAGLFSDNGAKTKQGLEELFGVMHLGHFALTNWLLPQLRKPLDTPLLSVAKPARVINVASYAFMMGSFLVASNSSADGLVDLYGEISDDCRTDLSVCPLGLCPISNCYARAKLANVLHARELQRFVDDKVISCRKKNKTLIIRDFEVGNNSDNHFRRVLTASLHPGSVHSKTFPIPDFIRLLFFPFFRADDDAGYVLLHAVLDDTFTPGSYIDAMKQHHHLGSIEDTHQILLRHSQAYPVDSLNTSLSAASNMWFNIPQMMWMRDRFVSPLKEGDNITSDELATRLWVVSEGIVNRWMNDSGKVETAAAADCPAEEASHSEEAHQKGNGNVGDVSQILHVERDATVGDLIHSEGLVMHTESMGVGEPRRIPIHLQALRAFQQFMSNIFGRFNFWKLRLK